MRWDYYPRRPWIWSSELDAGSVGDADLFHINLTVGASWHRLHAFTGYDYRRVGGVDLRGPVFGATFRF